MSKPSKYLGLTPEEFDDVLAMVVDTAFSKPSELLIIPGVYEILAEQFNNEVLERWEDKHEEEESE